MKFSPAGAFLVAPDQAAWSDATKPFPMHGIFMANLVAFLPE